MSASDSAQDQSTAQNEWGVFGRPLFLDEDARALSRVGVVDVGSNSVRMVVFDGAARSPAYFYNEKILCGLGSGLRETGRLNPQGKLRAMSAIKRFQKLASSMGIPPLTAVATAAMREAEDGPEFREEILRETGLNLWVIDGEEEARLSAQGVLLGWPDAKGMICDIGGSSMELAIVGDGTVGKRLTSPLGPLKLQGLKGGRKGLRDHIKPVIANLSQTMGTDHKRIYLVGGSWRAIARIDMERRGYPLHVLHEYRMSASAVSKTIAYIRENNLDDIRAKTGTSSARMALVPIASEVLRQLVRSFKPKDICISSYGIREGMLYEQMPQDVRARDPLIEACRFAEHKDARVPGVGKRLHRFIEPIFSARAYEKMRLIRAACLLHDVTWRAHPDYRAEVCFDNATRANLGGLAHKERVFLGVALLHRYKNSRDGSSFAPLIDMLSDKELHNAEVLGKAMRFGAMIAVDAPDEIAQLKYFPKKKELILTLRPDAEDLFGEVAESRFMSLASALGATPTIKHAKLKKSK
ncbi:exopolyphosphatase/guanosine-5'-triphosphate,3'-diphosphate pyrophosphatase [Pacificibacter maritimus]|uniref:Exopolyphosphatase/guanosine-5'-triphosphate, 3'-diphosphate pyrophosphatase n=1 Tax=Pacificibacter maritimus TaxID=762213 RepID=A0A3N4V4J3_9RHOB|nr:Ppx/GppA family phosphatase [Pacificibacter maritimus]RPE72037.1 exopolyphosphatase/guanosine-5'-triphosphate,3'-diphosphate pyrophosphatase [Pacificibacter maritimus]